MSEKKTGLKIHPTIKRQSDKKPGAAAANFIRLNQVESELETVKRIYGLLKKLQSTKYPEIIWRFDPAGEHLKDVNQRSFIHGINRRGFPDLMILFQGRTLFLEIKRGDVNPDTLVNPIENHGREQLDMIKKLQKSGYSAGFAIGFDMAFRKIYDFLDNRPVKLI